MKQMSATLFYKNENYAFKQNAHEISNWVYKYIKHQNQHCSRYLLQLVWL